MTETTQRVLADVESVAPTRIVFDSLSEFRLLAGNPLRYRRQILALKQCFAGRKSTVLLLDDLTSTEHDMQGQSVAHGAVLLEHTIPAFGSLRRRLSVTKYRSDFRGGYHDYRIRRGGLDVFPRLVAAEHRGESSRERLGSGIGWTDCSAAASSGTRARSLRALPVPASRPSPRCSAPARRSSATARHPSSSTRA
ncbi:MAG TPA: ATPase domain-containing protein [Steroidobacteraceae bacterium]|nr:ATPase domain-containing protein [Steroidobacteraceae bacterium]